VQGKDPSVNVTQDVLNEYEDDDISSTKECWYSDDDSSIVSSTTGVSSRGDVCSFYEICCFLRLGFYLVASHLTSI